VFCRGKLIININPSLLLCMISWGGAVVEQIFDRLVEMGRRSLLEVE